MACRDYLRLQPRNRHSLDRRFFFFSFFFSYQMSRRIDIFEKFIYNTSFTEQSSAVLSLIYFNVESQLNYLKISSDDKEEYDQIYKE